jgi:hypothetical protein
MEFNVTPEYRVKTDFTQSGKQVMNLDRLLGEEGRRSLERTLETLERRGEPLPGKANEPQYHNGLPPGPDMVEHSIESPVYRRGFKTDDAEICIGVQPGDELGQIFINVQLEGAPQQYNAARRSEGHAKASP